MEREKEREGKKRERERVGEKRKGFVVSPEELLVKLGAGWLMEKEEMRRSSSCERMI